MKKIKLFTLSFMRAGVWFSIPLSLLYSRGKDENKKIYTKDSLPEMVEKE